jgi:hypothetical protein
MTNHEQFSSATDSLMSYSWDLTDGNDTENTDITNNDDNNSNGGGGMFNLDSLPSDFFANLPGTSMSALTSLDFGEWGIGDHFNANVASNTLHFTSTDSSTKPESSSDPTIGKALDASQPDGDNGHLCTTAKNHDCHKEAWELLGRSLFANTIRNMPNLSAAMNKSSADQMALDHLLLLNRKSSERVSSLLACSCASSPYLMMLYASLISAILTRYQHAAGGMLCATWSLPISQGPSGTDLGDGSTTPAGQPYGPAVAPARFAIGAFDVDDYRVQSALNNQLLAGEVRKVAHLVDQFASCHSDSQPYCGEQSSGSSSVNGLHQSLSMWLRGEHSRITDMIRTRLKELNT